VNVYHKDLITWGSSRTYLKYLQEFEQKGILKRHDTYRTKKLSEELTKKFNRPFDPFFKPISLNWKFKTSDAVLIEGRAISSFEAAVRLTLPDPRDFRELVQGKGAERTAALKATRAIYS
jgi:hypothetical protein